MLTSLTTLKALSFCSLLALAACGGPVADDQATDDLSTQAASGPFEPIAHYAAVHKLAARYAKNPVAVSLHGELNGASEQDSGAYDWTWTLMGDDAMFVDIKAGPSGNKVLAHGKRYLFAGQGTFDPTTLAVDGNDIVQLVITAGLSQPTELQLSAALLARPAAPTWVATCCQTTAVVDAQTGNVGIRK